MRCTNIVNAEAELPSDRFNDAHNTNLKYAMSWFQPWFGDLIAGLTFSSLSSDL